MTIGPNTFCVSDVSKVTRARLGTKQISKRLINDSSVKLSESGRALNKVQSCEILNFTLVK